MRIEKTVVGRQSLVVGKSATDNEPDVSAGVGSAPTIKVSGEQRNFHHREAFPLRQTLCRCLVC